MPKGEAGKLHRGAPAIELKMTIKENNPRKPAMTVAERVYGVKMSVIDVVEKNGGTPLLLQRFCFVLRYGGYAEGDLASRHARAGCPCPRFRDILDDPDLLYNLME